MTHPKAKERNDGIMVYFLGEMQVQTFGNRSVMLRRKIAVEEAGPEAQGDLGRRAAEIGAM